MWLSAPWYAESLQFGSEYVPSRITFPSHLRPGSMVRPGDVVAHIGQDTYLVPDHVRALFAPVIDGVVHRQAQFFFGWQPRLCGCPREWHRARPPLRTDDALVVVQLTPEAHGLGQHGKPEQAAAEIKQVELDRICADISPTLMTVKVEHEVEPGVVGMRATVMPVGKGADAS
jgi:hypothetical protein